MHRDYQRHLLLYLPSLSALQVVRIIEAEQAPLENFVIRWTD